MSRTKTELVDNVEITETTEAVEQPDKNEVATTSSKSGGKKMGLEFYLQKNPQKYTIAQLMRSKYKGCVKTENEWNDALAKLLGKKVIS